MEQLMHQVRAWIERVDFENDEQRLSAFYIQTIALIMIVGASLVGFSYAVVGRFDYVALLATDVLFHAVVLIFVRRKLLQLATNLFLVVSLGLLVYGIMTAGGIHATSSVLFPILLIFASVLLGRKSFLAYSVVCMVSIGLIIFAESRRLIPPYTPDPPKMQLFIAYCGMIFATVPFVRMITENLRSSLRQARERERELSTRSEILDRVGQAVVACTDNGTITFWNKAATDYYGWEAGQAVGQKFEALVPVQVSLATMAEIGATLRAGNLWSGELEIPSRDQRLLPVLATLSPLHDQAGRMTGWVGIAVDLTERKRAESALRESEDRFKSLFDYSVIGKSITHFSGEVHVNQAFCDMLGYSSPELEHRRWQELTHPDDIELTQREIEGLLTGEKHVVRFNKRFIHKNGSVVWVDLSSTLRRDQQGQPLYLMSSLVDVTERIQAEKALQESEARFHSFFNHSQDAMFLVNEQGFIIEANAATETLFHLEQDEIQGQSVWEFQARHFPQERRETMTPEVLRASAIEAVTTGQAPWINRITSGEIERADGERVYIQQTAFTIPFGERFRLGSIVRNINDQKKAEAFRIQAEAELHTAAMRQWLLDFSRELLATIDINEILEIIRRMASELVPHDIFSPYWVDESAGVCRPIETEGHNWFSDPLFQAWDIPLGQGIIGDVARKQLAECVNYSHLDPRSTYPAGFRERVGVEHSIFLPMLSGKKLIGILVLVRSSMPDFTADEFEMAQLLMSLSGLALNNARTFANLEQLVTERTAQLAASEERYRLISTVSSDYMFSCRLNEQGEAELNWTAGAFEQMTGYTFDEYVAQGGWRGTLHPDDLEIDRRDLEKLKTNQLTVSEVRTFRKDGEQRWMRVYSHPLWDAQAERLVGVYGAVQDITTQKQIEVRELQRREILFKVFGLGKKIAAITNLRDCLLEIRSSVLDLGFDRVGLFLYDAFEGKVHGTFGTDLNGEVEVIVDEIQNVVEGSPWYEALQGPSGLHRTENLFESFSGALDPKMRDVKEHLLVSAWVGDAPVALIAVDNKITQRGMTSEQIEALQLFAGYIGLAIQNARWSENLSKRVADLDAINRFSQILVSQPDLMPLIQLVGEQIRVMFEVSVVYIVLLDTGTNLLNFYYQYENGHFIHGTQIPYGRGMTSRVMETRQPVLINSNWEQEAANYDVIRDYSVRPSKASLTVPLLVGEEAIGAISLQDTERENIFTEDHLRQLTTLAANLAVAIDHARLYAALQKELVEHRLAEEAVRNLNAGLERRVVERTAALEAANRELESLSYTIGHDLRSPIRAIVAYSQMLLEELSCGSETAKQRLWQVHQVSQRMGQMVDAFLDFLRLDRVVLQKRRVDLNELVAQVIDILQAETAGRKLEFLVGRLPPCSADQVLLKQIFARLISNAIKFSALRSPARIEIGVQQHENELWYFVRDNGVGFEMKYSGKLFGVFQRLHHESEFAGIGIGLAIAQRAVQKHGGRIWAEAEVEQGATFYFTLG